MVDAGEAVVDCEGGALEGGEELGDCLVGWEDDGVGVGVWHFEVDRTMSFQEVSRGRGGGDG